MICGRMVLTRLMGMANPTPLAGVLNSGSMAVSVGMPSTWPCKSTSAPPMLSSTDTSIPCFHLPNRSFHLIVGSRKIFDIVALNQIGPPILQDTQKLLKAGAFRLTHSLFCDLLRYFLQKRIKTQSYFFIGKTLFLRTLIGTVTVLLSLRPSPIKN